MFHREELFKGTHSVWTWNILVDLQLMQIQEEHSMIGKQAYSLHTKRQVTPMWVVSRHSYFESSHDKSNLFIHGMENQLNTKSVQIPIPPKWKLHRRFHIRPKSIQFWAMWKSIYREINSSPEYKNSY